MTCRHLSRPHRERPGSGPLRMGLLVLAMAAGGCGGPLSTLDPAGHGARQIADLFWYLLIGAVIIWIVVIGLAIYGIHVQSLRHERRQTAILIIGGGTVFPTLVLAGYLVYALSMIPGLTAPAPEGSLRIEVSGEQWWWRVTYHLPNGDSVALANEVRLPVGEKVQFVLDSPDVIHSFWIPSLGGKMDMVPGRVTRLMLEPTKTGVYRGACAEYCGTSHALMTFFAVVQERAEFEDWVEHQMRDAAMPTDPQEARGRDLFLANGCGACHAVRGTPADGRVGPDLTHVAGRKSIGAGLLPPSPDAFYRWTAHTGELKPDVLMPSFGMLPREDLDAIAAYLSGLN